MKIKSREYIRLILGQFYGGYPWKIWHIFMASFKYNNSDKEILTIINIVMVSYLFWVEVLMY